MGYTLDQLLDATGLDDLSGDDLTKEAAAPPEQNLSKLAEELRRASEVPSGEGVDHTDLVEKTAAVAVLRRTLEEIDALDGAPIVKTAEPSGPKARFIKEALEAGHSPVEIAGFLQKQASIGKRVGDMIGRATQRVRTTASTGKLRRAEGAFDAAEMNTAGNVREMLRRGQNLDNAGREKIIGRLRTQLGDERLDEIMKANGYGRYKNLQSVKDVRRNTAKAAVERGDVKPDYAASANIAGKELGITNKQWKKIKGPAAYGAAGIAGGLALSRRGGGQPKGGRGPVIVTT